jgi:hypothetical protein
VPRALQKRPRTSRAEARSACAYAGHHEHGAEAEPDAVDQSGGEQGAGPDGGQARRAGRDARGDQDERQARDHEQREQLGEHVAWQELQGEGGLAARLRGAPLVERDRAADRDDGRERREQQDAADRVDDGEALLAARRLADGQLEREQRDGEGHGEAPVQGQRVADDGADHLRKATRGIPPQAIGLRKPR